MANAKCEICFLGYDILTRRPRCLHCGHSFCTTCLDKLVEDATVTCPTCRKLHNVNEANDIPINFSIEAMINTTEENEDNGEAAHNNESSEEESEMNVNVPVTTEDNKCSELCSKHNSELLFYCVTHSCRICSRECTVEDHPATHCTVITNEEEITDTKLHHEDELNTEIRKCAEFITSLQKKKADIETEESRHESLAQLLCQERDLVLGILGQAQANKRRMEACKREISLSERREEVEVLCAASCDIVADMKQWQQEQEDRIMHMTTEDTVLLELERRLEEEKSFHERECRKLVEERDTTSARLLEVENLRKSNQQNLEELIEQRRQDQQHIRKKDDKVIKGFVLLMIICVFSLWFTFISDDSKDISLLKSQLHESLSNLKEAFKQQDNLKKELHSAEEVSNHNCDIKQQELLGQKMRQLNGVIFERDDIRDRLDIESKSKKLLEAELQEVQKQNVAIQKHLNVALAQKDIMEQKLAIAESQKDNIEFALREAKKQRDELQREINRLNQIYRGAKPKDENDYENQRKKHNIFDILKDIVNSLISFTPQILQLTGKLFEISMQTFSKIWNIILGL